MSDKIVLVSEVYGPCIQGEGQHIGVPTIFIRCGGCDFKCSWCDSLYAVLPAYSSEWKRMTPLEIVQAVNAITTRPILVTLSGGNPAMQHNLGEVVGLLHVQEHTVTIETQGTVYPSWIKKLDYITLSPKPPSSGMTTNWEQLDEWVYGEHVKPVLKVVVFDSVDYEYARYVAARYPDIKMYLQVGNANVHISDDTMVSSREELLSSLEWLQQKALADKWYDCVILPQLHVLQFGSARRV